MNQPFFPPGLDLANEEAGDLASGILPAVEDLLPIGRPTGFQGIHPGLDLDHGCDLSRLHIDLVQTLPVPSIVPLDENMASVRRPSRPTKVVEPGSQLAFLPGYQGANDEHARGRVVTHDSAA